PFAHQVTLDSGPERLTTEQVELHLRASAARARNQLEASAKQYRIEYSFEVVRGVSARALVGASERDLVVAGALTRPIAGHFRVECRWWSSIEVTPGPFLLARHDWHGSGAVVMLLDDRSAASARLLDAAAQIAEAAERGLTVICPPAVAGEMGLETWIAER